MSHRSLLLALMILSACGRSETTTTSTSTEATAAPVTAAETEAPAASGPCLDVTEAAVSKIVGHEMKFGMASTASDCLLISASGDQSKSVSFKIVEGTGLFDPMAAAGQEVVSGVGDKAVFVPAGNMVAAVKGSRSYLGGIYLGGQPAKQQSIDLAKEVLSKM